ncbi:hypothetical protein QK292_15830 [Arthrobacter sp. AL08]|uniref:hypothetical protein n=1 Tax=unclassified Arthrobacter TaxID=235627 RepID=UPI00249B6C12|nr:MULTISPECIES: hypothetical protein [unclassified Arthrobacter]MDI3243026.1 hypothetical protein [Arthrobacter sp. AL05]MDI3279036.1 hypothetical protein [Arthrobacter sp. AL08]
MQSDGHQDELALKPHVKRFFWALCLPLLIPLGSVTPLIEQSHLFADDGWWKSLTWQQQMEFALLGSAVWIAGVTAVAILLSLFSHRWRLKVWIPFGKLLRAGVSLFGLVLVSQDHLDRLLDQRERDRAKNQAEAGPPKGRPSGVPGQVNYGKITTHESLYDPALTVVWRSTGLPFGQLSPSRGDSWEVHYGHLEEGGYQQFVRDEFLGRVAAPWEGVERLRKRDLQEGLDIHSRSTRPHRT